jgi:CheY-like chemotaxis protein
MKTGLEAAEALAGEPPALRGRVVLLDVNLPGLDGIGVLRHATPGAPVR